MPTLYGAEVTMPIVAWRPGSARPRCGNTSSTRAIPGGFPNLATLAGGLGSLEPHDPVGRHGADESLERQLAEGLRLDVRFDGHVHTLSDENLARLGLAAQPGREVGHCAYRAVVEASLEADPAQRGIAQCDPHGEAQVISPLAPGPSQLDCSRAHRHGHPDGPDRRIGDRDR